MSSSDHEPPSLYKIWTERLKRESEHTDPLTVEDKGEVKKIMEPADVIRDV
jgi:hypothetical protein